MIRLQAIGTDRKLPAIYEETACVIECHIDVPSVGRTKCVLSDLNDSNLRKRTARH